MNLNKFLFLLVLCLWLTGCRQHHANAPDISQNGAQQSVPIQSPQDPLPVITPTPELEITFAKGLKIVPKTIELKNERRRYEIDVVYPQIEGSKSRGILTLNRRIKDLVTKKYQWLLIPPSKGDLRHYEKWPGVFNSVDLEYTVPLATDELLSIYFEEFSYGIGAAHSVQQSFTINYDLRAEKPIDMASLFNRQAKHLEFISEYCIRELSEKNQYGLSEQVFRDELAPVRNNYESWNITKAGLRFNFDACKIDGCAGGKEEVLIRFEALKDKLRSKSPVSHLATGA